MDKHGVDKCVIANINGVFYKNTQPANEELFRAIKPYRHRFIPFAVINPTYADWEHDLDVCRGGLEMSGVRLYPQYHDYEVTHPACIELVNAAREYKMAVAFSLRLVDGRQRSWLDVDRQLSLDDIASVVDKAPQARFIVLHALIGREKPATVTTLERADLVFDTIYGSGCGVAGPVAYDLAAAIRKYGKNRFAFGTAAPFRDYVSPFLRIEVMKEADDDTKRLIWAGNAQRILGIGRQGLAEALVETRDGGHGDNRSPEG